MSCDDSSSFRQGGSSWFRRHRTSQLNQATSAFFPEYELRHQRHAKNKYVQENHDEHDDDDDDDNDHHDEPQSWGKGIVSDLKRTVGKHLWSEFTNFNSKTVAVSFFLFIAVIAPSITFGAVYAKRTNNYM